VAYIIQLVIQHWTNKAPTNTFSDLLKSLPPPPKPAHNGHIVQTAWEVHYRSKSEYPDSDYATAIPGSHFCADTVH
jgi:hypothetical protein